MSLYVYDHRLVQTAVIGHQDSDLPVILPMDAHELDLWRRKHPGYTYWCGLQLGGCGGELSDRRYTTKVCHFAHHPSAPTCHRTANGESSADHLFIKQGVRRLLDKRKLRGKVHTRNLGTGPGDAVDVHLPDSRRRLRFQLSQLDYRAWRSAADELAEDADDTDWIFADDGPITQQLLSRHGYCWRVRLETAGGERRVHIGTEARDRTVAWTPLEDCALTSSGIVTPHIERIRVSPPRPRHFSFPLQGGLVFALAPEADVPWGSPFAAEDRHLLVADVKPVDSPIVRSLISLPADTDPPPAEHVYRVPEGARVLVTESGQGWAIEANRFVRLNAYEAQRTGLWTPPPAPCPEPVPTLEPTRPVQQPAPPAPEPAPARTAAPAPKTKPVTAPRVLTRSELVIALRDALAQHARLRSTTTWQTLIRTVSPELANYSVTDRRYLLAEVDSPLREHVPVLSALIRHNDGPLPYLANILVQLGVPYAGGSSRIRQWAEIETKRAFAAYGDPPQAMPPRLSLKTERPVVARRPRHTVEARRAVTRQPAAVTAGRAAPRKADINHVRMLTAQLDKLLPKLDGSSRRQARRALTGAHAWLAVHSGRKVSAQRRRKVGNQSHEEHVRTLESALREAENEIRAARSLGRYESAQRIVERAHQRLAVTPTKSPSKACKPAIQPKTPKQDPVEELTRRLVNVAIQARTIPALILDSGRTKPDFQQRLTAVDRRAGPDMPLLSALVTGTDGGPVPFFRDILAAAGLAVPRTDEALVKIWRREQERAHAKHAIPPRPLPPRLVPEAARGGRSSGPA